MLLILLIFKIQIVCVMSSISEIIKIEHETRVDDPTCIRKMYLFREGNFTRAYDVSAWMMVHFVCGNGGVNQPKPTRRTLKDGTDFVFVGFPNVSMAKYIPSDLKIDEVNEKMSVVDISILLPESFDNLDKILEEYGKWKDTFHVKEEKNKERKSENAALSDAETVRGVCRKNVSLTMIFQQILGYDIAAHSPMEWGEFIKSLKNDLMTIV